MSGLSIPRQLDMWSDAEEDCQFCIWSHQGRNEWKDGILRKRTKDRTLGNVQKRREESGVVPMVKHWFETPVKVSEIRHKKLLRKGLKKIRKQLQCPSTRDSFPGYTVG